MAGYYDLILGLIPLALFGITGTLHFGGFALTSAVPIAGFVAVGLVGHALFVNGPVEQSVPTTSSSSAPVHSAD
ncbi:hypothetical protein ACFQH6_11350 [Halobacteriaceae archaeon GCM10025711]